MELRQLQYALQIAAERNFSRAAEKLHVAQPSLSQQLSKLEKELGVMLFQRNTSSVELTHAGERFVEQAESILAAVELLRQEMSDISQLRTGRVVVGSMPITGAHLLPHVLPVFKQNYADIEISLLEDSSMNLEKLTAVGQTDLSLLSLPLEIPTLAYEVLGEERIDLAVPPDHPLASRKAEGIRTTLEELKDEPFIVLKEGQGFRKMTMELCREAGFEPKIVFQSNNMETIQSLVATGMGVTLVPHFIARAPRSEFVPVYLPLAEPVPSRTLVIAYRRGRYLSKAAEVFIETFKNTVASLAEA
ncbi:MULTISPECIES: LysR family transcriptional regulator [unclassified Paenibacillus]|uniref:LysR family transcriptional regulator n=1 Tax=unclassified Paenibacillus TaxID=185978 RepID=UPI0024066D1E|nr:MULTISPECIES: LysR family transcriptional regulator [unclassified Paenibacillus]MDF9840265.1 LysR family hydrogen peroxide-inducible transcriptional activator [Paenibacillus sp. PastF-2]MDF9846847.1 LysR family hydrogen peroxide-inducible transcriptional activator [Paenibacillus sp. PastM-2]MDF9853419.1 LysR family hydrogen peroxide-inducible transcriptional activator [Paenibacillus sp. PastF-1]MDH6479094.1 LysR family hydrogen peroxide-inducible transcriptional activator [Paenibacillus sp. 